ncbi:hypothetical protein CAPTEDRAFT_116941, partial [Capitella teleta]
GDRDLCLSTNMMLERCALVAGDLRGVYICLGHGKDCIVTNFGLIESCNIHEIPCP